MRNFYIEARVWEVNALACPLGKALHFQPEGPGQHPLVHNLLQSIKEKREMQMKENPSLRNYGSSSQACDNLVKLAYIYILGETRVFGSPILILEITLK